MARRSQTNNPEFLRQELEKAIEAYEQVLSSGSLRDQVRALVPAMHTLRDLGASLIPTNGRTSARGRILAYLRANVGEVVPGEECMIVAGIRDYPRRIRELRSELGWPILSGVAAKEMRDAALEDGGEGESLAAPPSMATDDYMLVEDWRDEDAARRWKTANTIRRGSEGVQAKVLAYLRANVGRHVTSEELRYVADDASEWARRTRELRTEEGWPIVTRFSGDPSLPVGIYILAEDKQSPPHDRHIREVVRREVMQRDHWTCQWKGCGWSHERIAYDPRFLEAHHIHEHARGGSNEAENLVTLCNLHHDQVHATGELILNDQAAALLP